MKYYMRSCVSKRCWYERIQQSNSNNKCYFLIFLLCTWIWYMIGCYWPHSCEWANDCELYWKQLMPIGQFKCTFSALLEFLLELTPFVWQKVEEKKYTIWICLSSGRAIKHVKESIFTPEAGARRGVPKVLVVLTDGRSQDDVNKVSKEMQMDGGHFQTKHENKIFCSLLKCWKS